MPGKNKLFSFINSCRKRWPVVFVVSSLLFSIFLFSLGFFLYVAYFLPLPQKAMMFGNTPTTKIYDRNGQLLFEVLKPDQGKSTFIDFEDIPKGFIEATLSAEDNNFYEHSGVDFFASFRALYTNLVEGRIVSGGSTITQQLIRNLMGTSQQRDWSTKILESLYAIRLDHLYSKNDILEQYINTIYYGNISYGAQSAAMNYFGKNLLDLDLAELSFLAGLPQSPSTYNPYNAFHKAKKRQEYVLEQMLSNQYISQEEYAHALGESLTLRARKTQIRAPHFVYSVISELEDTYGVETVQNGGLQVYTTLDLNLQDIAENTVNNQVDLLRRNNVTNGALLAIDVHTGQILSYVGSRNYFDDSIAGAVDMLTSLRQPGSSIKPLTYLLSFEKGYTPATVIFDIPSQFETATGPYSPKNYDLDYHGPVRIRTALASSYNIPAVKTLEYVGVENFVSFLRILGIEDLDLPVDHYGLSLTLGGGEIRPVDMGNAFLTLANYGLKKPTTKVLRIQDAQGKVIYDWKNSLGVYVLGRFGKEHSYQIIDILKDPLARLPGFGEDNVLEISHEAAVKTGTTRNFKDNWTIGFTPDLLTVVWVGNADASSMQNISGVDGAAPIWANFMEQALAGKEKKSFVIPEGLVRTSVCSLSGMAINEYCPEKIDEWFVRGTEPNATDTYYQNLNFNTASGKAIYPECVKSYNPSSLSQKVAVVYPKELQKWAAQKGLPVVTFEPCISRVDYTDASTNGYPDDKDNLVIIDSPQKNDEYLLDSTLPQSAQKVPFRVTVPVGTTSVKYYIDEKLVGESATVPFSYLWYPVTGKHSLRAEVVLFDGTVTSSASSIFFVK